MLNSLPEKIDLNLVVGRQEYRGLVASAGMERLQDMGVACSPEINVAFALDVDRKGVRTLSGRVNAVVALPCNRCADPVDVVIEDEVELVLVRDEVEANALPEELEPYVAEQDCLVIRDWVEDEIILSLPVIVAHEDESQCEHFLRYKGEEGDGEQSEGADSANPFSVLSQFKEIN